MSEWIVDRLPTSEDADRVGLVWCTDLDGKVVVTEWNAFSFDTSKAWMQRELPEPYILPIDTSLAASLKRSGQPSLCQKQPCICEFCDRHRIIEAAKRWNAIANESSLLQAELDNARLKNKENDEQFYRLRMWCLEKTGVDTNHLIGKPGFPDNIVDCVMYCIDADEKEICLDAMANHGKCCRRSGVITTRGR